MRNLVEMINQIEEMKKIQNTNAKLLDVVKSKAASLSLKVEKGLDTPQDLRDLHDAQKEYRANTRILEARMDAWVSKTKEILPLLGSHPKAKEIEQIAEKGIKEYTSKKLK